ncbi:MAG TPA: hypothetical protein VER12_10720 [Polyangiaceae bacterium]|nr:hypothetical protein [Polyangiaceae bacterium]
MNLDWILRRVRTLALLLVGCWLVFSCNTPDTSQEGGSETHFLKSCEGTCQDGMQCICGVCTRACTRQTDCAAWPAVASCSSLGPRIAEQRCGEAELGAICDATCLIDSDCSKLDADRVCDAGYCRQLSAPLEPPVVACAASNLAPTDVLILGDVLIELSIFTPQLEQAALAAGILSPGEHFRDQATAVSSLLATGALSFDAQYTSARADGPPRVIIMDGGATDVLTGQCAGMLNPDCPAARAAVNGAEQLFQRFAKDGVEHVVYFFYGDPVGNPNLKDGLDVLRPLLRNVCGRSAVACHWLDLRPIFAGHPEYVGSDGLVFTDAGASATAAATFAFMQKQCVMN